MMMKGCLQNSGSQISKLFRDLLKNVHSHLPPKILIQEVKNRGQKSSFNKLADDSIINVNAKWTTH